MSNQDKLLTREEAAEFLGVRLRTLDRWRALGTGPAFNAYKNGPSGGGPIRYRVSDLERYLAESKVTPSSVVKPSERIAS
jgi:hypothetical protein